MSVDGPSDRSVEFRATGGQLRRHAAHAVHSPGTAAPALSFSTSAIQRAYLVTSFTSRSGAAQVPEESFFESHRIPETSFFQRDPTRAWLCASDQAKRASSLPCDVRGGARVQETERLAHEWLIA